jgi:hypothetical protein
MAKFTPSILVSQVSGRYSGSVFVSNPETNHIRKRAKLKKQFDTNIRQVKTLMASVSSRWRELTAAQRSAWIAATPNYTFVDRLGNTLTPTGLQLYTKIQISNIVGSVGENNATPSPVSYPTVDDQFLDENLGDLLWAITLTDVPPSSNLKFFLSGPLSAGISVVGPSQMVMIQTEQFLEDTNYDLTASWEARFGSLASNSGKKIFGEVWAVPFIAAGNDIQRLIAQSSIILP